MNLPKNLHMPDTTSFDDRYGIEIRRSDTYNFVVLFVNKERHSANFIIAQSFMSAAHLTLQSYLWLNHFVRIRLLVQ